MSPSDFDPVYEVGRPLLRRPAAPGRRSRCALERRAGAPGATLVAVGGARTATSSASASTTNDGYARVDAGVRVRVVARPGGVRGGREPVRRAVPGGARLPGPRPRRARRACASRAGRPERGRAACSPGAAARTAPGPSTSCASEGVEVVGPADHVNAAHDRVAMHAVRRELLRGAGGGGRACRSHVVPIPWPVPERGLRGGDGARSRRRAARHRRPSPSATCSSRTCAATASSSWRAPASRRSSRSGAGPRAPWPRR